MRSLGSFVLLVLASLPCPVEGRSWHVSTDHTGDAPTIQAGLDSASAGDTVLVACGVYREYDIRMKSGVCLRSATGDPSCATIDDADQGRVFSCELVDEEATIEGFAITGGHARGSPPNHHGGGIYCKQASPSIQSCLIQGNIADWAGGGMACFDGSAPRLTDCVFTGNSGYRAGAVFIYSSDPVFTDCLLSGNSAATWGGAVLTGEESGGSFVRCTISDNTAYEGGGVYYQDAGTSFAGCDISGNTATHNGGGVFILICQDARLRLTGCTISRNRALNSGGVHIGRNSSAYLEGCVISDNEVEVAGGGMYVYNDCDPDLVDCAFIRNVAQRGGGIFVDDTSIPRLSGCTIAHNIVSGNGGGIYAKVSRPEITRSIVAFNTNGEGLYCEGTWSYFTLSCVDIYGNAGGDWVGCATGNGTNGNFSADPLFCDAAGGDYTLQSGSPCLPGQHPDGYDCDLIGDFGEGCSGPTAVEQTTWGGIKKIFR